MRGTMLLILCSCLCGPSALGEEEFPYSASVSTEGVEVRCGPGWDYYSTDTLHAGQRVEVYRHEAGGWLAIRPPEGSHSWVPLRQVEAAGQDVVRVVVEGAVAWVGSSSQDVTQHKWQVRLDRGELLVVQGKATMVAGPGFAQETYCKIAPPPGEFRWIHAEHAAAPQAMAHRSSGRTIELVDFHAGKDAPRELPQRSLSSEEKAKLAKQVKEMNVDLSLLVTREINQWDLVALRGRADQLTDTARGTVYAKDARDIAQRIAEFEELQRRHQNLGQAASEANPGRQQGVSAAPRELNDDPVGTGVIPISDSGSDEEFSGVGWLMPVHSARRIAPPYALLDDDGQVKCYVTPSPGLNLRRYVREHVSVRGHQRQMASLRATLVTADRVSKARK